MSLDVFALGPDDDRSPYPEYSDEHASALIWWREVLRRAIVDPHNSRYAKDLGCIRDHLADDEQSALSQARHDWERS